MAWCRRDDSSIEAAVLPQLQSNIDKHNCRLFGPVSIIVQLLMGAVVLGTLAYKRQRERPQRPWRTWVLDISKQVTGQFMVHLLNVILSAVGTIHDSGNPCSLYFLNILLDSTLGVGMLCLFMRLLMYMFEPKLHVRGLESGEYDDLSHTPGESLLPWQCWCRQTGVYVLALFLMKLCVSVMLVIFPFLIWFGNWLLNLFGDHRDWQVIFSMAIFPLAMNIVQFWLIDSMLLYKPGRLSYVRLQSASSVPAELDNEVRLDSLASRMPS